MGKNGYLGFVFALLLLTYEKKTSEWQRKKGSTRGEELKQERRGDETSYLSRLKDRSNAHQERLALERRNTT